MDVNAPTIKFIAETWDEYYPGKTNIKYPPVVGQIFPSSLQNAMMSFDTAMKERQKICNFDDIEKGDWLKALNKPKGMPLIIPSGGKNSDWIINAITNIKKKPEESFWWARLLMQGVDVIFVVAAEELPAYQEAPKQTGKNNLHVVGYPGFGIGCGRVAGMMVAKHIYMPCWMTDDRTKNATYNSADITIENIENCTTEIIVNQKSAETLISCIPFGPFQVLTIINPKVLKFEDLTFPRYFIASKEDMALALVNDIYNTIIVPRRDYELEYSLQVHTDTKNPSYENKAITYPGNKGKTLAAITSSQLFISDDSKTVFNWKTLSSSKFGFKNMWDAVKLQEAAMFGLLDHICNQIYNALKDPKTSQQDIDNNKLWLKTYILPWFTLSK